MREIIYHQTYADVHRAAIARRDAVMRQVRAEIIDLINRGVIDMDDVRTIVRARVRRVVTRKPNPRYL
jgi:ribosomal protein L19E